MRVNAQIRRCLLTVVVMLASGCAGTIKNMQGVAPNAPEPTPQPGKALIVFMRPSGLGFAVQSSVFVMNESEPRLVGIVAAKTKVAWQAEPGKHLFMVVGESGDFMSADVAAGMTYFALVTPRMGMWKARFSLNPVAKEELAAEQFAGWLNECRWVEKSDASESWARDKAPEIRAKYTEYFPRWMSKPDAERPLLETTDGK